MTGHTNRRPRRTPLSREEVAHIIQLKKRKAHIQLLLFKKSLQYKILNVFVLCCVFVFWELIICFLGPCSYKVYFSREIIPKQEFRSDSKGVYLLSELNIMDTNETQFLLMVDDFIEVPPKFSKFYIGTDFILQKQLRGIVSTSEKSYRIFTSSPILLLTVIALFISLMAMLNNLNHNPYSLTAIAIFNAMILLVIFLY
jgi:hypothetical protein